MKRRGLAGSTVDLVDGLREFEAIGVERVMLQHVVHDDLDVVAALGEIAAALWSPAVAAPRKPTGAMRSSSACSSSPRVQRPPRRLPGRPTRALRRTCRRRSTPPEVAAAAACDERYVREWLEHQAVGGILEVEDAAAAPDERRYRIPPGHDEVLLDRDSVNYMAAFARMMVGMAQPLAQVLEAFRSAGACPTHLPAGFRRGAGRHEPDAVRRQLATEWLAAMPDVDERLRSGSARVADVACGTGWSSVAMAKGIRTPAWTDSTSIRRRSSSRARSRGPKA